MVVFKICKIAIKILKLNQLCQKVQKHRTTTPLNFFIPHPILTRRPHRKNPSRFFPRKEFFHPSKISSPAIFFTHSLLFCHAKPYHVASLFLFQTPSSVGVSNYSRSFRREQSLHCSKVPWKNTGWLVFLSRTFFSFFGRMNGFLPLEEMWPLFLEFALIWNVDGIFKATL